MPPIYLDCNATTPLEPEVRDILLRYLTEEYGNEGSRTHEYGARAKKAVQKARDQVAAVVAAKRDEVIFTSGATESNNLALLGLRAAGVQQGQRHVITTAIEHKAVLEPCAALERPASRSPGCRSPPAAGWTPRRCAPRCGRTPGWSPSCRPTTKPACASRSPPSPKCCKIIRPSSTPTPRKASARISTRCATRIDLMSLSGH